VLDSSTETCLQIFRTPEVESALIGLALLAAVPVGVKFLRRRRASCRDR
jgi:hypothetical protein